MSDKSVVNVKTPHYYHYVILQGPDNNDNIHVGVIPDACDGAETRFELTVAYY